jgi:putative FmdB family regulatory protein
MPTYAYYCADCKATTDAIRKIADRHSPVACLHCGDPAEYVISAPQMHVWNTEFRFPNVTTEGDGSKAFNSKAEYNLHKQENHLQEIAHDSFFNDTATTEIYTESDFA